MGQQADRVGTGSGLAGRRAPSGELSALDHVLCVLPAYPPRAPAARALTVRLAAAVVLAALGACASVPPAAPPAAPHAPAPPGWRQHEITRPAPPRVEPTAQALPIAAPSDAVVLIGPDGTGIENWMSGEGDPARWQVENGALVAVPGAGPIRTRAAFGDAQIHIEWMPAAEPEKSSQDRSNSGLFLVDGRYEVQILDNWENPTYADGRAGSIYGQFPPLADATRPPTEWQSYDVAFRMPRFDDAGHVLTPARLTVFHNGVLVQNNELLPGTTIWLESLPYVAHGPGRIELQDHGSPVRFRNLWVRPTPEREAPPAGYAALAAVDLSDAERDRLVGSYAREGGGTFVIERLGDGLGLSMPWRAGVLPIVPLSPTRLQLRNTDGVFDVAFGPDGAASGLTFTMGGATYRAAPE